MYGIGGRKVDVACVLGFLSGRCFCLVRVKDSLIVTSGMEDFKH